MKKKEALDPENFVHIMPKYALLNNSIKK